MADAPEAGGEVADAVRASWPRVMATLVADLADIELAEDAAQDAAIAALDAWARKGVPSNPGAWFVTVARRKAIDRLRREKNLVAKAQKLARLEERLATAESGDDSLARRERLVADEQLELIFGCCHPALSVEAQVALTLKAVCGLRVDEIAAAFLVPVPTMAQRLVRAKRKIVAAALPFRIPADAELLQRISVVHHVIYLLFNEGYARTSGPHHIAVDLSDEAIRLGELLADLLVDDAESLGLLALMLLTHCRRAARVDDRGALVLLGDQDRTLWDRSMIERGTDVLDRALRLDGVGPYQLQAAIAALHGAAADAAATDWAQILGLYRRWMSIAPTPVVELNGLAALAMVDGPGPALERLDDAELPTVLADYVPFWALRADLLRRLDRADEAAAAYETAATLTDSDREREFFTTRLQEL